MSKILTAIFMTAIVIGICIWIFDDNISPGAGGKATRIQTDVTTTCVNQLNGTVTIGAGCGN
ncbi:hypothetical protein [Paenibacillus sp. GXUN7292]|uniref:hypothetical protein n=1 Tax=Paenibacillus sp. GXUN7292 TaxID=3422499 RepID=UPI003D7E0004